MNIYFLKLRANIDLDNDLLLAEREVKSFFVEVKEIDKNCLSELDGLKLEERFITSHVRKGNIIGYLVSNPLVSIIDLVKLLSFVQEIWTNDISLQNEKFVTVVDTKNLIIPFFAMSEFISYTTKQVINASIIKKILGVISLKYSNPKVSKLITRSNTSTPHVHGIHTYKAKFFPRFVRALINSETSLNNRNEQIILDPFVGSGTTLIESGYLGFQSIGVDIDALSCLISETKAYCSSKKTNDVQKNIIEFYTNHNRINSKYNFPEWIGRKFKLKNNLIEKEAHENQISSWIERIKNVSKNRDIFKIALSDALTRKFNIRMMGTGVGRFALEIAKTDLDKIVNKNISYLHHCLNVTTFLSELYRIEFINPKVIKGNATELSLQNATIDFIITSPPYLPASSGREDYMIGKSISLTALDLMPDDEIKLKEAESMGSMTDKTFEFGGLPSSVYELYDWLNNDDLRQIKAKPTLTYYHELKKSIEESYRVLKPSGKAIYIIGKETVFYTFKTREILYKVACDNIFEEIAKSVGFSISEKIDIELDKKNKNARPRSLDKYYETAIIMTKST